MGMKPRKGRKDDGVKIPLRAKKIRAINRKITFFRKQGGKKTEIAELVDEKDALLMEMYAACTHTDVILNEATEAKLCAVCGYSPPSFDSVGDKDFTAPATRSLEPAEYLSEQGRILIRLGINIRG